MKKNNTYVITLTHSKGSAVYFAQLALQVLALFDEGRQQTTVKRVGNAEIQVIFGDTRLLGGCTFVNVKLRAINKTTGDEIDRETPAHLRNAAEVDYRCIGIVVEEKSGVKTNLFTPDEKQPHFIQVKVM